jgi:hypothetical protein
VDQVTLAYSDTIQEHLTDGDDPLDFDSDLDDAPADDR